MTQQKSQEFNQTLVNENIDITIVEYVKQVNELVFHVDISFFDDFIALVDKEGFTISHEMLFKYEILQKTDSANVLRSLNSYNLEEHIDFNCLQTGVDEGRTHKNTFYLTQEAFKMICMRSLKTKKFSHYYILLEKCIKYYNDFQLLKQQQQINKLEQTLKDRVIVPSCKQKTENLAVVYLEDEPEYQYYVIRGQIQHIRKQLKRLNKTEEDLIAAIDTPNSVDLWINIKDQLDLNLKLDKMVVNNKIINTGYFQLKKYFRKGIYKKS